MKKAALIFLTALLLFSCDNPVKGGKTVLVSVALDYREEESIANALKNTINDQKGITSEIYLLTSLTNDEYEEHIFTHSNGVMTINGKKEAWDKDILLSTIESLDTTSNDLIIFHYSGHGTNNGNLVLSYTADGMVTIDPDELLSAFMKIEGKKCIFLDSCYSGVFVEDNGILTNGESFNAAGTTLVTEGFFSSLYPALKMALTSFWSGNDGIWVMSAASSGQLSMDSGISGLVNQENYGAFTYYLLSAMGYDMEEDAPGVDSKSDDITFLSLYNDIKSRMSQSEWEAQTPQITLTPLDLVLFDL